MSSESGDNIHALATWLEPLLAQLQPAQMRTLARTVATKLRRSQADRVKQQRNPDRSAYKPRSQRNSGPATQERARVKAMFAKLRTAKHLKATSSPTQATVGFVGRAARIAAVHQHGLQDTAQPGGPLITYHARVLLGFTEADVEMVGDVVMEHLGK